MSTITIPELTKYIVEFDLASPNFNSSLLEIDADLNIIVSALNSHMDGSDNNHSSTSVLFDDSALFISAGNVQDAIAAILSRYGDNPLLYDTHSIERDHHNIDHSGITGVPGISNSLVQELLGGNSTEVHRHDTMYTTTTQLSALGVDPATQRLEIVEETAWVLLNAGDIISIGHSLGYIPDGAIVEIATGSDGTGRVQGVYPGFYDKDDNYVGVALDIDSTNINISAGQMLHRDPLRTIINGYIKIHLYRFK